MPFLVKLEIQVCMKRQTSKQPSSKFLPFPIPFPTKTVNVNSNWPLHSILIEKKMFLNAFNFILPLLFFSGHSFHQDDLNPCFDTWDTITIKLI